MQNIFLLILGGSLGTLCRYGVSLLTVRQSYSFPWGTFAVNLLGSFLIGLLWSKYSGNPSDAIRSFAFIGFLGGFTTFSSFALESMNLVNNGQTGVAVTYVLLTNILGLALVFSGYWLGKQLVG
jgi:CrcB protein